MHLQPDVKETKPPLLDGCVCFARLQRVMSKRGSFLYRTWTKRSVVELRFKDRARVNKMLNRLNQTWGRRNLEQEANIGDILRQYRHWVTRGKLALKLEETVLDLCDQRSGGPSFVENGQVDWLLDYPNVDLENLLDRIEGRNYVGVDAQTIDRLAGPGLKEAWCRVFGKNEQVDNESSRNRGKKKAGANSRGRRNTAPARLVPRLQSTPGPQTAPIPFSKKAKASAPETKPETAEADSPASGFGAVGARRRGRLAPALKLTAIAMIASLLVSAAGYVAYDPDLRAYDLFITEGAEKAVAYIDNIKHGSDYAYYLVAFSAYREGRYEASERLSLKLIASAKNHYVISDCYYLLGLINSSKGYLETAIGYLNQSKKIQESLKPDYRRQYLAAIELAKAYLRDGRLSRSHAHIQAAEELKDYAPSIFELVSTKALLELERGNIFEAERLAHQASKHVANQRELFNSCVDLGFIYWKLGDLNSLAYFNDKAEPVADSKVRRVYLNINKIALRNCLGLDYEALEDEVRAYTAEYPEPFLMKHLEDVRTCAQPSS